MNKENMFTDLSGTQEGRRLWSKLESGHCWWDRHVSRAVACPLSGVLLGVQTSQGLTGGTSPLLVSERHLRIFNWEG